MGKFEKGNKFGKGRPVGAKNLIATKIKEDVLDIVSAVAETIVSDIEQVKKLPIRDRVKVLEALLPFAISKETESVKLEMKDTSENPKWDIELV